jgi:pSer/pThr/pTyr-binding forkhead associated (FHA) protein
MAPRVRLIETGATPEETREVAVTETEFLIGRGADCDLRLPVAAISRHHCIIRVGGDEVSVIDLGSSNGTFVNGQRVRSQAILHGGDQLQLGPCHFLVRLGEAGEAEQAKAAGADPLAQTFRVGDLARLREGKKQA